MLSFIRDWIKVSGFCAGIMFGAYGLFFVMFNLPVALQITIIFLMLTYVATIIYIYIGSKQ